jgi:hypothetical protein
MRMRSTKENRFKAVDGCTDGEAPGNCLSNTGLFQNGLITRWTQQRCPRMKMLTSKSAPRTTMAVMYSFLQASNVYYVKKQDAQNHNKNAA